MERLKNGERVASPRNRYEIKGNLGSGGFGQAYLANEIDPSGRPLQQVCIKVTEDQDSWHRESYFGEVLRGDRRVIQVYNSFPLQRPVGGLRTTVYFLVSELAIHGTIRDFLQDTQQPWPPSRAKSEVLALLKVLNALHTGGVTHRDLTPMNIFVTEGIKLKLGDFGIAAQTLSGKRPQVMAVNPYFVTAGFNGTPPDDVFQMGQLLAALLLGTYELPITIREAKTLLPDGLDLKAVVLQAIGPKRERYADAYEMMEAMNAEIQTVSKVRSFRNKTVVFTGPLTTRREDAKILVLQAGGRVDNEVNNRTDILVIGGKGNYRGGGNKGVKLRTALKINRKRPNTIALIGEPDFRRLVRNTRLT